MHSSPAVRGPRLDLIRALPLAAAVRPPLPALALIVAIAAASAPLVQAMGLPGLVVLLFAISNIEVTILICGLMTTRPRANFVALVPRRLLWATPIVIARYVVFAVITLGMGNTLVRLPVIGSESLGWVGVLIGSFVSAAILGRMLLATSFVVARSDTTWRAVLASWRATEGSWPPAAVIGLAVLLLTIAYTSALQTVDPLTAAITIGVVGTLAACLQVGTYRAMFT